MEYPWIDTRPQRARLVKSIDSGRESDPGSLSWSDKTPEPQKKAVGLGQTKETKTLKQILKPQHNAQLLEAERENLGTKYIKI